MKIALVVCGSGEHPCFTVCTPDDAFRKPGISSALSVQRRRPGIRAELVEGAIYR